jgi:hypothetical protein
VPIPVSLAIAVTMSAGFFALGVFGIVRPEKLANFFQSGGGRADIFTPGGMRFVGVVFVIATPFILWSAIAQILD